MPKMIRPHQMLGIVALLAPLTGAPASPPTSPFLTAADLRSILQSHTFSLYEDTDHPYGQWCKELFNEVGREDSITFVEPAAQGPEIDGAGPDVLIRACGKESVTQALRCDNTKQINAGPPFGDRVLKDHCSVYTASNRYVAWALGDGRFLLYLEEMGGPNFLPGGVAAQVRSWAQHEGGYKVIDTKTCAPAPLARSGTGPISGTAVRGRAVVKFNDVPVLLELEDRGVENGRYFLSARRQDGNRVDEYCAWRTPYDACVGVTQLEMNSCADDGMRKDEAELNMIYRRVMSSLSDERRASLRNEERAWIRQRESECNRRWKEVSPGSMASGVYANCMAGAARERIDRLESGWKP